MKTTEVQPFYIIGIASRTTNENGQAAIDIPRLWNKLLVGNLIEQIPNKVDDDIYSVYTEYEDDYTKPYTVLLGCKVKDLSTIPAGFTGKSFDGGKYSPFTAKGKMADGVVFKEWTKIWNTDLPRVYSADFEVYGEKSHNPENVEVDIFIAVE